MFKRLRYIFQRPIETEYAGTRYGGWLIPSGVLGPGSICYCAGAGEDISFDVELVKRFGCEVWIIDPTPRAERHFADLVESVTAAKPFSINNDPALFYDLSAEQLGRLHYLPYGLWTESGTQKFFAPKEEAHVSHSILNLQSTDAWFAGSVRRLSDLMSELGHDRVDLLKLDIEGAETNVLDTVLEDRLDVRVICTEFDEASHTRDPAVKERTNSLITRLRREGYVLAHIDDSMQALFVRKDVVDRMRAGKPPSHKLSA
jgi:FkbM family methyltransferase